jgi:hypothetical protein
MRPRIARIKTPRMKIIGKRYISKGCSSKTDGPILIISATIGMSDIVAFFSSSVILSEGINIGPKTVRCLLKHVT